MPEDLYPKEKLQEAFDSHESDDLREARNLGGKDLEHLGLSENTRELVDLTLFLKNAARSNIIKHNREKFASRV